MSNKIPLFIKIIAPSAASEVVVRLFEKLPANSSYAFLLFVEADRQSVLPFWLKINQATSLKVWEATAGLAVLPNQVYVLYPAARLQLENGVFVSTALGPTTPEAVFGPDWDQSAPPAIAIVPSWAERRWPTVLDQFRHRGGQLLYLDDAAPNEEDPAGNTTVSTPEEVAAKIEAREEKPVKNGIGSFQLADVQQQRFIEKITDTTPDIIYILDIKKRRVTYINQRAVEVFGHDNVQKVYNLGKNIFKEVLHPDDYQARMKHIAECTYLKKDEIKEIEVRMKVANGSWRWFKVRDRAFLRNEDGTVLQTIGIITDIQEQKETHEMLISEHARLMNAEVLGHIGSFERPLPGNTMICSDEFYRIHGLEPENGEFVVDRLFNYIHPEDQKALREQIWVSHTMGAPLDIFHRVVRPDGAVRYVHRRAEVLTDERGKPVKVFGTVQDLTNMKQAYEEIIESVWLLDAVFNGALSEMIVLKSVRNGKGDIVDFEYQLQNKVAETVAGGSLVGKRYLELNPVDGNYGLFDIYKRVVETGEAADLERYFTGKGYRNWFRLIAVKLEDGLVLTIEDITDRKRAEEEAQKTSKLFQDVFQGVQVQINYLKAVVDPAGQVEDFRVILSNSENSWKVGKKGKIGPQRKISDSLPGYRTHELWERMIEVYQTGKSSRFECWYGLDGLDMWMDVSLVRHEDGLIYSCQPINDRKKAEIELTKTVAIFNKAEIVGGMGTYEADLATMNFRFSDNMYRLFGEEPHSFQPSIEFIESRSHPEDIISVRQVLEKAVENKQPYTYYRRIFTPEGEMRLIHAHGIVVVDDAGNAQKLLATIQDETERKRAEEAISEGQALLNGIAEAQTVSISAFKPLWDENGNIIDLIFTYSNKVTTQISGVGNLVGFRYSELFPSSRESLLPAFIRVIHTGETFDQEYQFDGDGMKATFRTVATKMGEGVVVSTEDITERKAAEQQLLQMKEELAQKATDKYFTLFNSIDEGFYRSEVIFDEDNKAIDIRYLEENPAAVRIIGMSFTGKTLKEINPAYESFWFQISGEVALTGESKRLTQYSEPDQKWFDLYITKVGDEASREVVVVFQDITDLKTTQQELQQNRDLLQSVFDVSFNGLSVLKSVRNKEGELVDMEYLFANQATKRVNKRYDLEGKLYSEVHAGFRGTDYHEVVKCVVETGEPHQYQLRYIFEHLDNWFNITTVKLGDGVIISFEDITEIKKAESILRESEERQAFLLQLSDELRPVSDPFEIQAVATRLAMHFFGADRCYYCEIENDTASIRQDASKEGLPSIAASYSLSSMPLFKSVLDAGHPIVVQDSNTTDLLDDNLRQLCIDLQKISFVDVPVIKNGKPAGILCLTQCLPRTWTAIEVALVGEMAERTWSAVERAKAEEALRQSEERLQKAISIETVGVIYFDLDGGIHDANRAFERMSGFAKEDFVRGKARWDQLTPPEFMEVTLKSREEFLTRWQNTPYEKQYIRPDGSRWWGLFAGKRLSENECVEFVLDITEQKETEQKIIEFNEVLEQQVAERTQNLIKQYQILRQSEEVARIGSWEYEIATDQLTWSEGMYRLFGLKQGSPVSLDTYYEYVLDADRKAVERLSQHMRSGMAPPEETFRIKVDKKEKWIRINTESIYDENQQPVSILGIDLDVTKVVEGENKLRKLTESMQIVLESSPAQIGYFKAVRNQEGNVVDFSLAVCNKKFATYLQRPIGKLLGTSQKKIASRLWEERTFEVLNEVLQTGRQLYEERQSTRHGKDYWLGISVIQQEDGVVITGLNITSLREAEQQQKRWMREVERSNETIQSLEQMRQHVRKRGEFLRTTSHDLRGSFGVIVGATSLLNIVDSDEERTQTLDLLQRNLRQVTHMVNQLLDFSRLESGQEKLQIARFDVAELLLELCESTGPLAQEKGLRIGNEGPESLLVEGDAVKVRRIAQNLVLNSIKYSRKGEVKVSWTQQKDERKETRWVLTVADTGPGLPDKVLARLTSDSPDMGFEDDGQEEIFGFGSSSSGEGIGLFIVKRLSELLKAKMEIEIIEGKGTRFSISFPVSYSDSEV
ncbi:PAS domain S-box protein [Telluribacter sp.]|jgi:two-component system CheB/CheR fusion protein|uniref:PAS domain S-box protein n=1 Tax=Telluribacter sp. TaxID=1978767 RepID=UPI002E0FB2B3|nr:PAS domain S-box protein [Telluribacter sp.]